MWCGWVFLTFLESFWPRITRSLGLHPNHWRTGPSERLPIINLIMQRWLYLVIGIMYCLKSCSLAKIWMNSWIFLALVAQLTNHLHHYPPSLSPSHFHLDCQKQKKQVRRNFQISLFLSTHSGSQLKRQTTEWQQARAQGLYKLQIVNFITAMNMFLAK